MNLIQHVEIPVNDIERAMRFYSHVFEIEFQDVLTLHGNKMAYFPFEKGKDGASGALVQGDVYKPSENGAIIYFGVKNIDFALSQTILYGCALVFSKTLVPEIGYVAEIRDSEGNRIAIQTLND